MFLERKFPVRSAAAILGTFSRYSTETRVLSVDVHTFKHVQHVLLVLLSPEYLIDRPQPVDFRYCVN